MMKLLPQFDIVACAQPFARIEDGNTSGGMAHGIGPLSSVSQAIPDLMAHLSLPGCAECQHEEEEEGHRSPSCCGMFGPFSIVKTDKDRDNEV